MCVACLGIKREENAEQLRNLDVGLHRKIILKWILKYRILGCSLFSPPVKAR
jgi:hypothetical protein